MKKLYKKPEIMFESFTLSTNIAGDCAEPFITNATKGSCAYVITDGWDTSFVFTSDYTNVCKSVKPDGYNGICYHSPTETTNLFNS